MRTNRDPRTKEDLLDRLTAADFEGDLRQLGKAGAKITRAAPHKVVLRLVDSGREFELAVHKRRGLEAKAPVPPPVEAPKAVRKSRRQRAA